MESYTIKNKNYVLKKGKVGALSTAIVSADEQIIFTASMLDYTIRIWKRHDRGHYLPAPNVFELRGHKDWIMSLALSEDGKTLISGSNDSTIRIWNMDKGKASE